MQALFLVILDIILGNAIIEESFSKTGENVYNYRGPAFWAKITDRKVV